MTPEQRVQLETIVSEANLVRIFRDIDNLGQRLEAFAEHYASKSKGVARGALPSARVSLDGVLAEFRSNPYRVEVLLQATAFGCSPEMLVMIWMSELGCNIQTLSLDYKRHGHASLNVELRLLDASTLVFRSSEVWDLAVMRFAGLATLDDRPEMSGFYPMSVSPPTRGR